MEPEPRRASSPGPGRRSAVLGLLALAGCGFAPVHAPGGGGTALRGQVLADAPLDRAGYVLVRRLEERLGLPAAPRFRLAASIRLGRERQGITPDGVTTRQLLRGRADWQLIDIASGGVRRAGVVESFTGYGATSTVVATQRAREDAEDRLMVILADRIVGELLAAAAELGPP